MNPCERFRAELAASPQERPARLRAHLLDCEACAAFAEDVAHLVGLARALPGPSLDREVTRARPVGPVHLKGLVLVGACSVLIAMTAAFWLARPGSGGRQVRHEVALATAPVPARPGAQAAAQDLDLFAAITEARRVWVGQTSEWRETWLDIPAASSWEADRLDPTTTFNERGLLSAALENGNSRNQ